MSSTNVLIDRLSDKFEVSERQEEVLKSTASLPYESSHHESGGAGLPPNDQISPSVIGLTTSVSTFVAQKNFHNFAVPQFASHWGVVCDFGPRARTLFHLLFDPVSRKVIFESTSWKQNWSRHRVAEVGKSSYDYPKILEIGKYGFQFCIELINQGNDWRRALKKWGNIIYYFGIVSCLQSSISSLYVTSPNK